MSKLIIYLCIFLIVSCASNERTYHYTLHATTPDRPPAPTEQTFNPSVGIGPLSLPAWLEKIAVVSYRGDSQLTMPYYHVWAGDLAPMILNVLAEDISVRSGWAKVLPFPWDNRHRPEWQVRIHIEEFAGTLGKQARLRAKWALLGSRGRMEHFTEVADFTLPLDDPSYDTYVNTLNQLLLTLSKNITSSSTAYLQSMTSR